MNMPVGLTKPEPVRYPESNYVEFWQAGARVIGVFACAACGRAVRSVRQLPDCPRCAGRVWELPDPTAVDADPFVGLRDVWFEDEVENAAGLARGIFLAVVAGATCWLIPVVGLYVLFR